MRRLTTQVRTTQADPGRTTQGRTTGLDSLKALVLVRIGQELGTDSQLARAVHDAIDAILALVR
jgi:hypothetical protein